MRIALAQINPVLGDFSGNSRKILEFTRRALEKRAHLVVFSEMSLFGYPAYDFLERQESVQRQERELTKLLKNLPFGITVIFGAVVRNKKTNQGQKPYHNVAVVARKGTKTKYVPKQLLPSYDVFDDTRFFEPGKKTGVITIPKVGKVAITVCEDMWQPFGRNPLAEIKKVDLIVNISASPYSTTHLADRLKVARQHVKKIKAPFVYVNQVGGQDELIFDGRSFILDKKGKEVVRAAACQEDLVIADLASQRSEYRPDSQDEIEQIRQVLVLGIRDFLRKTKQASVHLGLSGGIDSAVVAALSVDALGANHVTGILLPGPFSSHASVEDAQILAQNLKIKTHTLNIVELYELVKKTISPALNLQSSPKALSIMEQNIQARLRGLLMMAYSNASQSMLLTTVNKSELATGYGTIYGDLSGGLAPIADLVKGDVYKLARHYNQERELIPKKILEKAPSAELAPNQKDQDTLPPYELLDKAVKNVMEKCRTPKTAVEQTLMALLFATEWKRWQTPPVLRVTDRAFGKGRRYPISIKTPLDKT